MLLNRQRKPCCLFRNGAFCYQEGDVSMNSSFIKTIYAFISFLQYKFQPLPEPVDPIQKKLEDLENQIDLDNFDPILSLKIDQIIDQIESRKQAPPMWHVGDP